MNVLMVEPGKAPYETQIGDDLQSMQAVVGGYIQAVYPYEEPVALICCESGKLDGLPHELAEQFAERFRQPEMFMRVDGKIVAAPMPDEQVQGGMSY